jgi:hypothetical protein
MNIAFLTPAEGFGPVNHTAASGDQVQHSLTIILNKNKHTIQIYI